MSQVLAASRPRGAHRCDGPSEDRVAVADLRRATLALAQRTARPRPRPQPRPRLALAQPRPTRQRLVAVQQWVRRLRESPAAVTFHRWAAHRPFWAGLFLVVAGVEIGLWPTMPSLVATRGAGVSAVMFMALLVTDGLAVWFVPLYRKLLGVQAAALGLLAITTTNLGGFFVGTGAAVLGGAMAFRWTRTVPAVPRPVPPAIEHTAELALPRDDRPVLVAEPVTAPIATAEPIVETDDAERDAVEPTADAKPTAKAEPVTAERPMAVVGAGSTVGRHVAHRPRPAASAAEDDLVAIVGNEEQSFIPGF